MIINDIEARTEEGIEAVQYLAGCPYPNSEFFQMAMGLHLISMLDAILLELREINDSTARREG